MFQLINFFFQYTSTVPVLAPVPPPIRGQYPGHVTSISQSEDQETEAGAGETGVTEETVVYFTPGPEVRQMCVCPVIIELSD